MRLRAAVPALALALLEHASGGSAFLLPAFVPSPRPSSAGPFRRGTVLGEGDVPTGGDGDGDANGGDASASSYGGGGADLASSASSNLVVRGPPRDRRRRALTPRGENASIAAVLAGYAAGGGVAL